MMRGINEIKDLVNTIVLEVSSGRVIASDMDDEKYLLQDLRLEPVELLEIFITLSETFGIEIKPEDTQKFKKMGDIYRFIKETTKQNQIINGKQKFKQLKYIKIFTHQAYVLGILSDRMVENLEACIGFNVRLNIDLTGINISTLYAMQHIESGCQANCAFCVQARESHNKLKRSMLVDNKLMRFPMQILENRLNTEALARLERICIQTIYNDQTFEDLLHLVISLRSVCEIPITACSIPASRKQLIDLKEAGLDMIVINYEVATPELFSKIRGKERKGPYRWEIVTRSINDALDIFGDYKVGSHLQVGHGETQKDILYLIQEMKDKKAFVSLLAFKPLPGTALEMRERISHAKFHQVQLGSYLIQTNAVRVNKMEFDSNGNVTQFGLPENVLKKVILSGDPFRNRGCPGCNRVYYETNPGERFYSYPRALTLEELQRIECEILMEQEIYRTFDLKEMGSLYRNPFGNRLVHRSSI